MCRTHWQFSKKLGSLNKVGAILNAPTTVCILCFWVAWGIHCIPPNNIVVGMIRTLKTTLLLRLGIAQGKPLPTTLWASATSRIKIVKMKQLKSHTWGCHCLCPMDVVDPIGFCLAEIGEPTFSQEGLLMTMEVRPEQGAILQLVYESDRMGTSGASFDASSKSTCYECQRLIEWIGQHQSNRLHQKLSCRPQHESYSKLKAHIPELS